MSKKTKGFTMVEIVVVLTILSVLAGAGVPAMLKYVDKAKEKLCLSNKLTIVRLYKSYSMLYPDHNTLQEVLDGKNEFLKSDFESLKCPSGGILSAANGYVVCSIHGSDSNANNPQDPIDPDDPDNPDDPIDPPTSPQWTILGNIVVGSANKIFDAAKATSAGKQYVSGLVFGKENKIYAFGYDAYLGQWEAQNYVNNLDGFGKLIKINTNNRNFSTSDFDTSNPNRNGNWKGSTVKKGDFFTDGNGQTWIFMNPDAVWVDKPSGNGPSSAGWLKLLSGEAYSD
jgi:prepilin-type N-terminal cleavage/methylation domain-containing protein